MGDCCDVIPTAVRRRLVLNLVGCRLREGVWHAPHGTQMVDEEALDSVSDEDFEAFLAQWLAPSAAN